MTSPVSNPNAAKAALSSSSGGLRTSGGAKKLIIRGFDKKPTLPSNFEEDTWAKLRDAVSAVHTKQHVSTSLEELYKAAEDLCTHKLAASLYRRLQTELEQHIFALQRMLLERLPQLESAQFLALLNATWQDHCDQTKVILSIFLFLDRTYVIQTQGVKSIWDLGLSLVRQTLLSHEDIQRRTASGLLLLVERERSGETIDRSLLKSLVKMLSALGIYTDVFERPFLDASKAFYAREGALRIGTYETAEYMLHVEARLKEEADRINACLESSTRKPLIALLEQQLVAEHVASIVEKGFAPLMKDPRTEDLARMYNLLARVGALDKLKAAWNAWIKAAGVEIVGDPQRDKTMVEELLALKAKLDGVATQAFHRNDVFLYALKEALEHVVNCRPNRPAELIAKFVDGNLRLLLGKSASIDAERSMIAKLKTECGANFTNKLEGMFKDIDLSKETMVAFRASPFASRIPKEVDMSVQVLTSGYWPTYPVSECRLPAIVAEAQEVFREFYTSKHSGRRLLWQHSLGQCSLKAHFAKGRKELSLSLFQAVVLLLFNDAPALAFSEILAALGMNNKELQRTLQSLACGKVRILNKEPKTREVGEADRFSVNEELAHKLYRIKVNAIQMKETTEENQKVAEGVFQDRQYQIDAAIVRIMKTRKQLQHAQLISELYAHLKFPLKPTDLKKRIESLIEREYLERDPNNANIYNYLA